MTFWGWSRSWPPSGLPDPVAGHSLSLEARPATTDWRGRSHQRNGSELFSASLWLVDLCERLLPSMYLWWSFIQMIWWVFCVYVSHNSTNLSIFLFHNFFDKMFPMAWAVWVELSHSLDLVLVHSTFGLVSKPRYRLTDKKYFGNFCFLSTTASYW